MKEDENKKRATTCESSLGTKTLRNAQCLSSEGEHHVPSSWQLHDLMTLKQNVKTPFRFHVILDCQLRYHKVQSLLFWLLLSSSVPTTNLT